MSLQRAFTRPRMLSRRLMSLQHASKLYPGNNEYPQTVRHTLPVNAPFSSSTRAGQAPAYTSVDETEVTHFSALASSWWDPHGPSRLLHLMNPLRHNFIASCLKASGHPAAFPPSSTAAGGAGQDVSSRRSLRYLDIGCGGGIFAESAARLPTTLSVTAIDPTPAVLTIAKEHARRDPRLCESGRLEYRNIAIEDLSLSSGEATEQGRYDVVTLFEVLEHVAHAPSFLAQAGQHVKPGGWLVLSTIARTWTSWATTIFAAEEVLRMVPRGTHEWSKYVNEPELRKWFSSGGEQERQWELPRTQGVVYVPGFGWKEVPGSENLGNYFFGIRKKLSN
ncbi:hypothetical protein MRB53_037588 [Persea americana]|nr:hypothetical protein MRB53_037588 [Persea americana]